MARGRRTSVSNTRKGGKKGAKSEDEQSSNLGCSISDIPRYIWFEILLMLSVKELLFSRCACKAWRNIISEVEFAKLYFAKSGVHTLIRPWSSIPVSRILYLVDYQPLSSYVDHFMTKLDTKLYIPLPNSGLVLKTRMQANLNVKFEESMYTSELPLMVISAANPQTNQYQVIRMFDDQVVKWRNDLITGKIRWTGSVAEIHTLGTSSWRMIGDAPSPHYRLGYETYLNGAIHWLYSDIRRPDYIVSFNFDNEKFQPIPVPDYDRDMFDLDRSRNITLGELRGCLQLCGLKSGYEAITYTPKFISLKDAIVGEDVKVLKINSRFAGLKSPGERITLSLDGTTVYSGNLFLPSYDDNDDDYDGSD